MSSIDSPPRYFSATLPPPKTKMHAASTQVMMFMMFMPPPNTKMHFPSTQVMMFVRVIMMMLMMFMPPHTKRSTQVKVDSDAGQIL